MSYRMHRRQGCEVNFSDGVQNGWTPLHVACLQGQYQPHHAPCMWHAPCVRVFGVWMRGWLARFVCTCTPLPAARPWQSRPWQSRPIPHHRRPTNKCGMHARSLGCGCGLACCRPPSHRGLPPAARRRLQRTRRPQHRPWVVFCVPCSVQPECGGINWVGAGNFL